MTQTLVPGYLVGTWKVDTAHSEVGFSVRHMMVSKVRGRFTAFDATIVTAQDPTQSSVTAEIDLSSIDTGNEQRDGHIRSADFFDVDNHAKMTYRSTSVVADGSDWKLEGELTLRGITKAVPLKLELNGFTADPYGGQRAGFSASGELNRSDFGVSIAMPMDGGGVVVSEKVTLTLEIEAVLQ
jgi:polyisoprenoid-binding protein YceI